jgi:enoyl-CoA hydratase/carnithine racemase
MIPPRLAMEILLTGDPISAERAYEIGLVNRVVPDERLVDEAQKLAETIAANAPLSVLAAKKTVRLVAERSLSEAFDEAERIWEPVYLSDDAKEGPRAFRDRRPPDWTGH